MKWRMKVLGVGGSSVQEYGLWQVSRRVARKRQPLGIGSVPGRSANTSRGPCGPSLVLKHNRL